MRSLSIKIPNVSQSLETKLEGLILGGAFWPDQPLTSERRLSDEFAVSRTSMRSALASLCEIGLLKLDKRHHVTNVMADLLCPGFRKVVKDDPQQLLDYWLLLFGEATNLVKKKAQNSDRALIKKCVIDFKRDLIENSPDKIISSFEALTRSVMDGCYNFFLSQTHHALYLTAKPYFAEILYIMGKKIAEEPDILKLIDTIDEFEFDNEGWSKLLNEAFEVCDRQELPGFVSNGVTADKLIEVILRHSVAFESVYELRLITEKHAASMAAQNASLNQKKLLRAHLEKMTIVANMSTSDYSSLDTRLHRLIAQSTQNRTFAIMDAALAPIFSRTTNQWLKQHMEIQHDQSAIHLQHTQIVEAILDCDSPSARASMKEHLAYVLRNLRNLRQQDHLLEIATARQLLV